LNYYSLADTNLHTTNIGHIKIYENLKISHILFNIIERITSIFNVVKIPSPNKIKLIVSLIILNKEK
jgi:hypothetical protein